MKKKGAKAGNLGVAVGFLPVGFAIFMTKGLFRKTFIFFAWYSLINPFYDAGIYARFWWKSPEYFKKLLALDEKESFAAIQTRLFIRSAALKEMEKAAG